MIKRGGIMINIKKIREEKGILQTELAEKLNINQSAVAAWETGKAFPRTERLREIASILGCTVDELLEEK